MGSMDAGTRLALKVAGAVLIAGSIPLAGLVLTTAEWKGAIDSRLSTVEVSAERNRQSRDEANDALRDLTIAVRLNSGQLAELIRRIDERRADRERNR